RSTPKGRRSGARSSRCPAPSGQPRERVLSQSAASILRSPDAGQRGPRFGDGRSRAMRPVNGPDSPRLAVAADQFKVIMNVRRLGPFSNALGEAARSQLGAKLLVVDHPPQGQKQLPVAAVAQSPTTQHARFLEGPSLLVHDDRSAHRERLQDDITNVSGKSEGTTTARAPRKSLAKLAPPSKPSKNTLGRPAASSRRTASCGPVPAIRRSASGR